MLLLADGKAIITYTVRYNLVPGQTMLAFTMSGFDRLNPVFDQEHAWVITDDNTAYELEIVNLGGGNYDLIHAGEKRLGGEHLTYKFRFAADMYAAGYLAKTTAADGSPLVVFNWSPTQWDEQMEYYTVTVTYPLEVSKQDGREEIEASLLEQGFATEPWMNEEYLLDYRANKVNDVFWAQVLLHKATPGAYYQFRIQQYIDADVFTLPEGGSNGVKEVPLPRVPESRGQEPSGQGGTPLLPASSRTGLVLALRGLFLVTFWVVGKKHRSHVQAKASLEEVQWARTDWEPPKLEIASFRKDGTIAKDLDSIEAAMFLGVPYQSILAAILAKLIEKG